MRESNVKPKILGFLFVATGGLTVNDDVEWKEGLKTKVGSKHLQMVF